MPGWKLSVRRLVTHHHAGRIRTYGSYQVTIDDVDQPGLSGFTLEARGPGSNGAAGKGHTRVAAGVYPVGRHATAHYRTEGYPTPYDQDQALPGFVYLVPGGVRDGLLVHPAHPPRPGTPDSDLWLSSIGCINPTAALADDQSADFTESGDRVVALIQSLRTYEAANFHATPLETALPHATIEIIGEPA